MSRSERAVLLLLLTMCAGAADGWSFLGFGDVFVANMTGNTVLMGISIFRSRGGEIRDVMVRYGHVLHPAVALVAYAAGVAIASYVTGRVRRRKREGNADLWTRSVTNLLAVETLVAAAVEWGWYTDRSGGKIPMAALMAGMAICMGLQSGAMLQLQIPGVVTTYITGTWTVMMRGLTRLATGEKQGEQGSRVEFEERLEMQAVTLAVYLLSAVVTGWLFEESPRWVGLIPVLCLATVSVWSGLRGGASAVVE